MNYDLGRCHCLGKRNSATDPQNLGDGTQRFHTDQNTLGGLGGKAPHETDTTVLITKDRKRPQAVSPVGSANPCARAVAVNVLAKRQAIVIGPTPPGTGVIAPATVDALA